MQPASHPSKVRFEAQPTLAGNKLVPWLVILAVFATLTVLYQNGLVVCSPPGKALPLDHASYSELLDRHFSELRSILSFNKEYLAARSTWWLVMPSFTVFLVLTVLVWLGFRCIDVNTFSIQNLYRNRLVRCYLGATNQKERLEICRFRSKRRSRTEKFREAAAVSAPQRCAKPYPWSRPGLATA